MLGYSVNLPLSDAYRFYRGVRWDFGVIQLLDIHCYGPISWLILVYKILSQHITIVSRQNIRQRPFGIPNWLCESNKCMQKVCSQSWHVWHKWNNWRKCQLIYQKAKRCQRGLFEAFGDTVHRTRSSLRPCYTEL